MEDFEFIPDLTTKNYLENRPDYKTVKSYETRVVKELAKLKKETIKLKGASGKPVEMTLEELAKKKINGKIEVIDETYYVKLTRWYRLEQTFDNLKEAINALVKLVQKIDTIKYGRKTK